MIIITNDINICADCYYKYFPIYKNTKIIESNIIAKCEGCGEYKKIIEKVEHNGEDL